MNEFAQLVDLSPTTVVQWDDPNSSVPRVRYAVKLLNGNWLDCWDGDIVSVSDIQASRWRVYDVDAQGEPEAEEIEPLHARLLVPPYTMAVLNDGRRVAVKDIEGDWYFVDHHEPVTDKDWENGHYYFHDGPAELILGGRGRNRKSPNGYLTDIAQTSLR